MKAIIFRPANNIQIQSRPKMLFSLLLTNVLRIPWGVCGSGQSIARRAALRAAVRAYVRERLAPALACVFNASIGCCAIQ